MTIPVSAELDDDIRFVITIPPEVMMELPLDVECVGKVLRIQPISSKVKGVAVGIQSYRFKTDEASSDSTESSQLLGPRGPEGPGQP
jgi:hypothetical protein